MRKMIRSVLIVANAPNYGGTEKYAFNLACELFRRGISVAVVMSDGPFVNRFPSGIPVYVMPISRKPFARYLAGRKIRDIAIRHGAQVIHAQCRNALVCSSHAGAALGIPVVSHEHHSMYTPADYEIVIRELETLADRVVTIAPSIRRRLEQYGLPKGHGVSIRNGIDTRSPEITRAERTVARASLGLEKKDRVVLCASRLVYDKGILELVRAFDGVRKEVPNSKLVIVGDDEENRCLPEALRLIRDLGLENDTLVHSGTFDLRKYHAAADVFCHPSLSKGLSVMEAMAAGLPVVGKEARSKPVVVEDGVHGFTTGSALCSDIDPEEIAQKLVYLLTHPGVSRRMGKAARRHISARFGIASHADRILGVYRDVVRKKAYDAYMTSIPRESVGQAS